MPPVPDSPPAFTAPIADPGGSLVVGGTFTIVPPAGTTWYRIVLYSAPLVLAEGFSDQPASVTVPTGVAAGDHTLVLWAIVDGQVVVQGQTVTITAQTPSTAPTSAPRVDRLPATGANSHLRLTIAAGLVLAGVAVVLVTRRRGDGTLPR